MVTTRGYHWHLMGGGRDAAKQPIYNAQDNPGPPTKIVPRKTSVVLLLLKSPEVEKPFLLSSPGAHTDL